jgi:NAD(P)-dependent dehydrogenase (short-subunit alcohol dehydrogenase family)
MKVIVIGATGTIGSAVVRLLSPRHQVVSVAHSHGALRIELAEKSSILELLRQVGPFDALVCAAGVARFGPLEGLSDEDYRTGLDNKLMGQVNLVRLGRAFIAEGGSFTLTSGVLSRQPMVGSSSISMVNAAIEAFVRAAALELPHGMRINAVSPVWVTETLRALGRDTVGGVPAAQVALAYQESIEGVCHGEVLDVRDYT